MRWSHCTLNLEFQGALRLDFVFTILRLAAKMIISIYDMYMGPFSDGITITFGFIAQVYGYYVIHCIRDLTNIIIDVTIIFSEYSPRAILVFKQFVFLNSPSPSLLEQLSPRTKHITYIWPTINY